MKVLVTGSAGSIGSALSIKLLDRPASPHPDWDSNNPDPAT